MSYSPHQEAKHIIKAHIVYKFGSQGYRDLFGDEKEDEEGSASCEETGYHLLEGRLPGTNGATHTMTQNELLDIIALGEDSARQFKADVHNVDSLASEMAAFANAEGGAILIGVENDGATPGLSRDDVARINQLISNAASQHVRSPLSVQTENIPVAPGRLVIVVTVPKGIDKPYFDRNGVIWLKVGSDKRRINSKEELRRLFQFSDQFHADELPTAAGLDRLDKLRFRDFLRDAYKIDYPDDPAELLRLLRNMDLATEDGNLNLAGVLLFTERPEWIKPQFIIKAIRYPGNDIHADTYLDTEDFTGPLQKIYADALAFVMRNLHKVQAGRGVNAPGTPEIPPAVFEELLVNALIHRDYLVSATIRLFIFDNRIEIISPGHLPNNLTVERIRAGISNIRNPILVSYVAKGMLPYHGLGSGITRALEAWPEIEFADDREGCQFTAMVQRKAVETSKKIVVSPTTTQKASGKTSGKTSGKILKAILRNREITIPELARLIGVTDRSIERNLQKLQNEGHLRRVGPAKGGHWEVAE